MRNYPPETSKLTKYKESVIAIVAVSLFIMSLIAVVFYYSANKSLTRELNVEKLKTEMMLSEKLELQKELQTLKNQINLQLP